MTDDKVDAIATGQTTVIALKGNANPATSYADSTALVDKRFGIYTDGALSTHPKGGSAGVVTPAAILPDFLIHSFYQRQKTTTDTNGWCEGDYVNNVKAATKTLTMNAKAKYSTKCTW